MQPGIYLDLPNDDYHASNGISKSGLSLFAKCPEQYHWKHILGNRDEEKSHFGTGKAFHTATTEPDKFDNEFVVAPDLNKNSNAYKDWASQNSDRQILNVKDYDVVMGMSSKIRRHTIAKNLLADGIAEASIYAIDEITGELVKVRPDWISGGDIMVDLKSTTDASAGKFFRDMFSYGYHLQAGMYPEVFNWVKPGAITDFVFIVVEKTAPYSIGIYRASHEDRMIGADNFRRNLNRYANHKARGYWPSYNKDMIIDTALPTWAKRSEFFEDTQL